jgi:hypothetical protein
LVLAEVVGRQLTLVEPRQTAIPHDELQKLLRKGPIATLRKVGNLQVGKGGSPPLKSQIGSMLNGGAT